MLKKIFAKITKIKQFVKMQNPKTLKDPVLGKIAPADQLNVRIRLLEQMMMFAILIWQDVEQMGLVVLNQHY